jgi:hypothetical protein
MQVIVPAQVSRLTVIAAFWPHDRATGTTGGFQDR